MLKVYIKIKAIRDIQGQSFKKGDVVEMINDIFDNKNGVAYWPFHKDWKVIEMRIIEYKQI